MENDVFTKESHHIGDKLFSYYRPSQSRKIPLKTLSNRGFMPSLKSHLNNVVLEYEALIIFLIPFKAFGVILSEGINFL